VSKRDFSKTETKSYQPQTFKQLCIRYNNLFQERNMDVVISILKKVHIKLKHYKYAHKTCSSFCKSRPWSHCRILV